MSFFLKKWGSNNPNKPVLIRLCSLQKHNKKQSFLGPHPNDPIGCLGAFASETHATRGHRSSPTLILGGVSHLARFFFFPTSLWGFCFLACIPPAVVRRRPPSSAVVRRRALSHTHHKTYLIIHKSCHIIHNSSHITHHSSHTQLISHNTSHTDNSQHHSSHTTHLTQQLISHTTHLTHNSSHTPRLSHTTHLFHTHTSQNLSYLSHTQLISHTTHLTHLISQTCCLAGAVHRAFCRSCGARGRSVAAAPLCVAGAVHRAS